MKRTSVLVAAAALAVSGLGLGGCSGATPTTHLASYTAAPVATPSGAASGAVAAGTTLPFHDLEQRTEAAMAGVRSGRMSMSATSSGLSSDLTSTFVVTGPATMDALARVTVHDAHGSVTLEMRAVGDHVYVQGLAPTRSAGKAWASIDPGATDPLSRTLMQAGALGVDPQFRQALDRATASVLSASGGTTTYRVTGVDGFPDLQIRLVVDARGLPVNETASSGTSSSKVTYSDWGAPVTVTAPPAEDVGPLVVTPGSVAQV